MTSLTDLLDLAAAHYAAGRMAEASGVYEQAEAAAPMDVRAIYSLAIIDIRCERLEPARRRLKRVARRDPRLVAAHHNLGYVNQRLGHWREAAAAYEEALSLDPAQAETRFNQATILAILGRTEAAIAHHRILAANPLTRNRSLTRIALLKPAAIADDELAVLSSTAWSETGQVEERLGLLFALGASLDARRDTDAAFSAFAAGNALRRQSLTIAPDAVLGQHAAAAAHVRQTMTAGLVAAHAGGGLKAQPIFIVGMPRSGSTLLEQILSSHRSVQAMGESAVLGDVLDDHFPYAPRPHTADHFASLARAYLDKQRAAGWDGRSRLVDKTLENYLHVGAIRLMFPRAIILHSVRDPVDTGFACFRQLFDTGNETLYDLADIAAEYRLYRQVIDHWRAVLPGFVTDIDHEALVQGPEDSIRVLVTEACGLGWDPACLHFDRSDRAVITASAAQVRQPIFTTSLRRWRPYARHLRPLIEGLAPYASTASSVDRPS